MVSAPTPAVIRTVENAARNESTLLAPGLIIAIKGSNLGPATGVSGVITNGAYETTLSEVRVLFDGIAAPILFARQDQVNTVAPYALFGRTSTRVQVEYRGIRSEGVQYNVVDTAPGIFTQDGSGRGLGSILNQNNTVNTANNPARRGEVIAIYATGEGNVRPSGADGRLVTGTLETLPRPTAPVFGPDQWCPDSCGQHYLRRFGARTGRWSTASERENSRNVEYHRRDASADRDSSREQRFAARGYGSLDSVAPNINPTKGHPSDGMPFPFGSISSPQRKAIIEIAMRVFPCVVSHAFPF